MAGWLAASLTSLKSGGWRVKGDHAVPAQPAPYRTQQGPQAPSRPGSQGLPGATRPLAESAASPANHGGRLLSALGACALGPARGGIPAAWGLPPGWPRFLAVVARRSFEVRRRSCLPGGSQTRSLLRPCGEPLHTHPTHPGRPEPLTSTGNYHCKKINAQYERETQNLRDGPLGGRWASA